MAVDETLKFSWGHIVAIVTLIFISYVSFVGTVYMADVSFISAGLVVLAINLVLIVFFIVPQLLKGTDEKFGREIRKERILLFLSPLFFVLTMIPFSHFCTVFGKRTQIETVFSESVNMTKGMFDSYELYANERMNVFKDSLSVVEGLDSVGLQCRTNALKLQILDANFYTLKKSANDWIDKAEGASVWNVFMIGNIKSIENAVNNWLACLNGFSNGFMEYEPENAEPFEASDPSVTSAMDSLNSLRSVYTSVEGPSVMAIAIGLILYLLLLFPYLIQIRNRKNTYTLRFGKIVNRVAGGEDEFVLGKVDSSEDDSDYSSFTL
jgi:hypothetical protein